MGVESAGFEGGAAIMHEQAVKEGEKGIGRISRGAAGATLERNCFVMVCEEMRERRKIGGCGIPFDAAQGLKGIGTRCQAKANREEIGGLGKSEGA